MTFSYPSGVSRALSLKSSKWFQQNILCNTGWVEKSKCGWRQDLPWIGDTKPDDADMAEMTAVCSECPVLRRCADYALNSRNGSGVEGGFYAGQWLPWPYSTESLGIRAARSAAKKALRNLLRPTPVVDPELCSGSEDFPAVARVGMVRTRRVSLDRGVCSKCNGWVSIRKDGRLRRHAPVR